jgi:ribosomal protein L7/L12
MSEIKNSNEVSELKEKIKELNLGQISELIDGLKKDLNIQEQAVVQSTAAAPAEEKAAEKGKVSVKFVEIGKETTPDGKKKIYELIQQAIKEIKEEDKNLIEVLGLTRKDDKIILADISNDEAEKFQKKMEILGAKVEIIK